MGHDQQIMTAQTSGQSERDQPHSALHRKAQVGRVEHQTHAMSVPKALRLTVAKVANEMFGMAMAAIGIRMEKRDGDALAELFEMPALLMALDGPSGRRGAAVFDPNLVGGLIQQQTMGKVMPEVGGATRPQTATDAAICAPFLDALLDRAAVLPETEIERQLLQGYRFGIRAEDARILLMSLEAPEYQVVHITVDIAGGCRQGQIILCLPIVPKPSEMSRGRDHDGTLTDGAGPRRQNSLNDTVMALHVDLNVALARISMPVSTLGALAPGDVFELGITAFDQSRVLTMCGTGVGRGTLGQIDGVRALRVEHQNIAATTPKRRASDREGLDLPDVTGDGTGTRATDPHAVAELSAPSPDLAELPVSNAMNGVSALPDFAELPDLPDLPDMSDLPGFTQDDDLTDLPRAGAG